MSDVEADPVQHPRDALVGGELDLQLAHGE
jgi:hypothetical protein